MSDPPAEEMTASVTFVVEFEEAKAFWAVLKRRKPQRRSSAIWAAAFYGAVFLGLCEVLRMQILDPQPSATGAAIAGIFVAISGMLAVAVLWAAIETPRAQRRAFEGMLISRGPVTACADGTRIEVSQAGIVSTYPWTSFTDMRATPFLFLLFVANETAVIVPRRAVHGTSFGALVEARCAHGVVAPWNP